MKKSSNTNPVTGLPPICIYHSKDFDGLCCGAIMKRALPVAEMIGYDYGQPFDIAGLAGRDVYMADVSFSTEDMLKVAETAASFVWIDHHKTAYEAVMAAAKERGSIDEFTFSKSTKGKIWREQGAFFYILYSSQLSACELVWRNFYTESIPKPVEMIGAYDVWRDYNSDVWNLLVLPFQYWLRAYVNGIDDFLDFVFAESKQDGAFEALALSFQQGRVIIKYQDAQNRKLCSFAAFDGEIAGHRAIILNTGVDHSRVLRGSYDPERHDLMVTFSWYGGLWHFSLRAEKEGIDCGKIAAEFGGGGHKGAAGFRVRDIYSVLPEIQNKD